MRPLIGLSVYREQARWGVWDTTADLLPSDYAFAVESAGGTPVLLPPTQPFGEAAESAVARLDGLIISGGADVDPSEYRQLAHATTTVTRPDRDAWEFALLDAADAYGIPVLGICRGMQVMAVHAGGVLDQHVPDLVHHTRHSPGGDEYGEIAINVAPGSLLSDLIDAAPPVRCHHHQSVRTHPGFVAVAHATDGVLEAFEAPGDRFRVGVQWHPEVDTDRGLFAALVTSACAGGADRPS